MKKRFVNSISILGILIVTSSLSAKESKLRIVTLNGPLTEIVFALGESVIGCDSSSVYPESTLSLPKIGYQRTLSAEGILSLKPDLVLGSQEAGPPETIEQIKAAGLKVVILPSDPGIPTALDRILKVGDLIERKKEAEALVQRLRLKAKSIADRVSKVKEKPRVIFIYSRGQHLAQVSGYDTPADEMIRLAGGKNAITEFKGFRPLSPEAVIQAKPDILLIPTRGLESLGGAEGLLKLPGILQTPAGKSRRILSIDDLVLLGFGPRFVDGLEEMRKEFDSQGRRQ
ncbi:hemin ABC transporter substrate-binding protein [Leptospira perolatii]|uniref:Hemin ABC transporter substrate-binding protein n=1 Tax=Leptospira perolatii TaxID=2023191 RepID=A0A2M9ZKH4_9LEPT|nr:hemin ABC transporter substrate-binding protein [Leptospira perolatii]PJZ69329.1 hemin ABC transporter substrate-binding protein [Leptospira perolatii]PJZ72464.1 hemin ABC transporter substrate-binding protein [Leptospira perolatii]